MIFQDSIGFIIKQKSYVLQTFIQFQCMVERQFNARIKEFQSDWGRESRAVNFHLKAQEFITESFVHIPMR